MLHESFIVDIFKYGSIVSIKYFDCYNSHNSF